MLTNISTFLVLMVAFICGMPQLSTAGEFSDIDLEVREAIAREFNDTETCIDLHEDIYNLEILRANTHLCDFEIFANVKLAGCGSYRKPGYDVPIYQAIVCIQRQDNGYSGRVIESLRNNAD